MDTPEIISLNELKVTLSRDVYNHLSDQYSTFDNTTSSSKHIDMILEYMKTSPSDTCCRVNLITSSVEEVIREMKKHLSSMESHDFVVERHKTIHDLVTIRLTVNRVDDDSKSMYNCSIPPSTTHKSIFPTWHKRKELGWPMSHRAIIVDRFCGEAVLRGSNIFVRGIMCADSGIEKDEEVAVYADLRGSTSKSIARGLVLESYNGQCVFLGIGISCCKRSEYFAQSTGLGVRMIHVAGPRQPSMNSILEGKMMLQNLPSVCVAHALDPQPGDFILDMCCAPGGKTTHVASLMRNKGLIVACDKSRKKMASAKQFFKCHGASCIVPLALDSTKSLLELQEGQRWMSPKDIIDSTTKDGLKVKGFYANSFDKVLLDPPCSALGLRPKLLIDAQSSQELAKFADYQKRFVCNAVKLLKPGGTMTYSTCTINASENEDMVKYILTEFPSLTLLPIPSELPGLQGLPDRGLTDEECKKVRRFDPCDIGDTMGFFLAKFIKSA